MFDIFENIVISVGMLPLTTKFPHGSLTKSANHGGTNQHEEQPDHKSFEVGMFRIFLVLEFILMRVLKSGKMIGLGSRFLCSFLSRMTTSKFLEQRIPPQSVLA
ncbi:hypothetical protein Tco_0271487 [Tanacetum coccineum]